MTPEIRPLPLSSIALEDSRYRLSRPLAGVPQDPAQKVLLESLGELGLQSPLCVHEVGPGSLHLLDGFCRAVAARALGWAEVPCRVLEPETPLEQVLKLLLAARRERLERSVVLQVRFVRLALDLGVPKDTVSGVFLPLLGKESHAQVLRQCTAVAGLPEEVLDFCEKKRFSLKQCVYLSHHPPALVALVFSWRDRLSLTASVAEELLEHLKDHLRANEVTLDDFARRPEVRALLEAPLGPQERTRQLRELLRRLRFPLLTGANDRLEGVRTRLGLPGNVRLSWDPTLERHAVDLRITIQDPGEWPATLEFLGSSVVERGIAEMLEEL